MSVSENTPRPGARLTLDVFFLLLFCAFLFFYGLGSCGLIGADEPRYAQVAREMLARHDWVTPTLNGAAWLEKPPFYYWQAMVAYRIFGVSDWAARLPSAVDATFMVAAVYFFLRRLRPGLHLDGALIVASSAAVIGFARAASTDMPLAATFTIALLSWYCWFERRKRKYLIFFYHSLAWATLAKGPVAILLAVLIILLFSVARRNAALIRQTISLPGISLFCLITLPWFLAVQLRNPGFFRIFIMQHNLARFGTNLYHHAEPFWYFWMVVVVGLIPWVVFALAGLGDWLSRLKKPDTDAAYSLFLTVWLIVPIIFFSISQSKLPGYILPAIPAGCLLAADYLRRHAGDPLRILLIAAHVIIAAVLLVPVVMIQYIIFEHRVHWGRPAQYALGFALAIAFILALSLKIYGLRVLRTVTLIPVVLAVAILVRIGSPALDAKLSARSLAENIIQVESRIGSSSPLQVAVFEASRDTEFGLHFYLNRPISRYESHQIPAVAHLVIAPAGAQNVVAEVVAGRRVSYLGSIAPQRLDYFLVSDTTDSRSSPHVEDSRP